MTKENIKRIHLIYGILLSIIIVIAGICFIVGCVNIYYSGEDPFSRETVANTFSHIAFPVYLCLAMTIIGFLLEFFLPLDSTKKASGKNPAMMLQNLYSKKDLSSCEDSLKYDILALRKNRKLHILIRSILLILGCLVFLIYAVNGKNFHQSEINASMIKAMCLLIPCLLVPFVYAIFTAYHNNKSMEKEIELLKTVPSITTTVSTVKSTHIQLPARLIILGVALFLLIIGFIMGGTADVLTKAINICTECIGLG